MPVLPRSTPSEYVLYFVLAGEFHPPRYPPSRQPLAAIPVVMCQGIRDTGHPSSATYTKSGSGTYIGTVKLPNRDEVGGSRMDDMIRTSSAMDDWR